MKYFSKKNQVSLILTFCIVNDALIIVSFIVQTHMKFIIFLLIAFLLESNAIFSNILGRLGNVRNTLETMVILKTKTINLCYVSINLCYAHNNFTSTCVLQFEEPHFKNYKSKHIAH